MTDSAAQRPQTPLDRFAESWLDETVERHPELRVELNRRGNPSEYADYSPNGLEHERAAVSRMLAALESVPIVDETDEITALELRRTGELSRDRLDAGVDLAEVNNIETPAHTVRMIFDLMPQQSVEDFAAIAERLRNVSAALTGYRSTLREGVARRIVPARRQVRELAAQSEEYARAGGFFSDLIAGVPESAPESLRRDLAEGAAEAQEAYGGLSLFLSRELGPAAREEDAVGRERYSLASREFLGARVDLDETYEWGIAELDRVRAEQAAVADELYPGASVKEAVARLDADPAWLVEGAEHFRAWMQERSDEAIEALDGTHFDISGPMRALECRIAPTQEGIIYYTGPSDDFSRPGRMWWSVPKGQTSFGPWRELTTVYHEGVPGHHLQIATATRERDKLNGWRRVNWVSGHGEGWALYAERLMDRLGYLDHPAYRLGMLDGQRLRAARVVLDIGVHLGKRMPGGGPVWNYDDALTFLEGEVNMDPASVRFELNRYFGWPGQAPSYKIGQRVWEQLRDAAEAAAGSGFRLRDWHSRALSIGSVGLDTLTRVLRP